MYRKYIEGVRAALQQMAEVKEAVTSADKKPQNVVGPDGRVRVRMVPVTKKSEPKEQMYQIPEDIPQNERTAFHGAAAAAAKAGKKSFNFGGKTHPVTMKKDVATKIADQKEAVVKTGYGIRNKVSDMPGVDYSKRDNYSGRDAVKTAVKKANAQSDKKRAEYRKKMGMKEDVMNEEFSKTNKASMTIKHGYDEGDGPDNKKFAKYINKNTGATVKHHKDGSTMSFHGSDHQIHKALQHHHSDDKKGLGDLNYHKKGMTHSDDHVDGQHSYKAEGTTIRDRLMGIWEEAGRAKHYKGATKPEPTTKDDERSAKKMKDGHSVKKDDHEETSGAAEKSTKPSAMRGNDNKQGDKNIIPSATKDTPANKVKKEEYGIFGNKISNSLLKAYSVVEEYTHEFDVDPNHLKKVMSAAKKNGIKAKVHTMNGPGGGNPVVHLGHKDTNHMHKFIKKHYDPDYEKSDLNMHKL